MFEPDPNRYKFAKVAKHHLPNVLPFQIQPYHPTSHFQSLSFSLSLSTTNPRTSSNRGRDRGEEGERLNLAFREWLGRCLETFRILFTPGRFQPKTAKSWQGLFLDTASFSFLSVPCLLCLWIFESVSLLTLLLCNQHLEDQKQTSRRLALSAAGMETKSKASSKQTKPSPNVQHTFRF